MTPLPTDPIGRIRRRLAAARRRMATGDIVTGVLLTLGVALAAWIGAALLEGALWLPAGLRTGLLALVVMVSAVLLSWLVVWPILKWTGVWRGISDDAVADRIGRRFPDVKDRLLNMIQLLDGRHSASSEDLVQTAALSLGDRLQDIRLERVEDYARVRRAGRLASLPLVGLLAFLVLAPDTFFSASGRLLEPTREFSRPAPFSVSVLPGDVELVKGADLDVEATLSGSGFPGRATLESRYTDEAVVERVDLPVDAGAIGHTLVNVRRTLEYRVVAGSQQSPWFTATVVDRPAVGNLQVLLRFPAYTRMPPQALAPNEGDITALAGTEARIEAVVGGPEVTNAQIGFEHGSDTPLEIEGRQVSGAFRVLRDDTWHIEAVSADGIRNVDPVIYEIRRVIDTPPSITLTSPESEFDLDESTTVPLGWRIADDFGFTRLRLHYRLETSRFGTPADTFSVLDLPLEQPTLPEQDGFREWRLSEDSPIEPAPGDVILYFLEVTDNDGVSGPKSSRTDEYRLRMPSLAERYEALDEREDDAEESMEEVLEESSRMRDAFEELQEQLRSKTEADWQDQRAAEQLQQRQESLEESVRDVAEQIESMNQEMERNDLVGEETLEMFRELQEVAEEINSPELMEALKDLQEAMQQMDLQQMQQAMEQFRFNEEQYRQRLERTLELFKNLRVQQDLEEAARRAEDLAETEEELAERTEELERQAEQDEAQGSDTEKSTGENETEEESAEEKSGAESSDDEQDSGEQGDLSENERLAQEQERAASEMEQLQKMMEELRERMEEVEQAPSQSMDELSRQTESQQMPQQMRQNAEQLQQQQFSPAQQSQQEMSQQLRDLQQQLQQMLAGMQGAQQQMNMSGLRRALDDVLALSADQEGLRADVQTLTVDSPQLRETAQSQMRLSEGLSIVADSLQSLARQIPQMDRGVQIHAGEANREMADATTAMTDRTAQRAVGHQKGAMTHLNELALLLSDLLDQMMGGGGGSGSMSMQQMMQQLQNMAGQQQQLNQQIQQMLNDIRGNRLSSDSAERLRQMSEQQRQIREQLRDLSRNRELRNQALGDLERIAEQMQETIEELELRQLSPTTIQRQRQILTRLLEASRSLQERGRDRRRESRTGEDVLRESPAELSPQEQADQLRRDLIRALESGYAPDFEELIRRYFDLLQQNADPARPTPSNRDG